MPEYLTPGLYVEEVDSGSKPIEGVGTNTAAFIGYAKSGEFNKPTFISSWSQFCDIFGQEENAIAAGMAQAMGIHAAEVTAMKRVSRKGWMDFAQKTIESAAKEKAHLKTKDGAEIESLRQFQKEYEIPQDGSAYIDGTYLAHAVFGFYQNGGGRAYIIRVARPEDVAAYTETGGKKGIGTSAGTAAPAALEPARAQIGPMTFTAKDAKLKSGEVSVELEPAGPEEFRLKVTKGGQTDIFPAPDKSMKVGDVARALERSQVVTVEVKTKEKLDIAPLTVELQQAPVSLAPATNTALATTTNKALVPVKSPVEGVTPGDFQGNEARRTGITGLSVYDDINMICAPDLMAGLFARPKFANGDEGEEEIQLDDDRRKAILAAQCDLVSYCEGQSGLGSPRIAILDPIPGLNAQEMRDLTLDTPYGCDKGHAAIYYPWIKVSDPLRKGKQVFVPPSGHIAGVWARVGNERGVHKAPANEVLRGAVELETNLTKMDQAILNPNGINAIRSFPGEGIKIYGARTLATVGNKSWMYVNVRRLFDYLELSIQKNMTWAVFEPNDADLWGRLRRNINAFLSVCWREGMLFGAVPGEAYYIKCDAENNTQETIDLGRVYVEVGINPVKPAEFVIIRMGQWSGGSSNAEG